MKLRLAFLFALACASTAQAILWIVPSRFSAAGASPAWYYNAGLTSTSFASESNGWSSYFPVGGPITVGQSGTVKKISAQGNFTGAGSMKLALFDNAGTPSRLSSGGTVTITGSEGVAWIEVDISADNVTVTNGQTVQVWCQPSDSLPGNSRENGTAPLYYYSSGDYATFPPSTVSYSTISSRAQAVRVYVQ